MNELEIKLEYSFENIKLLENALTHSSYANENKNPNVKCNERLEFLGDAVLGLVSAEYLYNAGDSLHEGMMTKLRAAMVCEQSLAEAATQLGLGAYLKLGKGEAHNGGAKRPSILADAMEAIIAAVYIDGGFEAARALIKRLILKPINENDLQKDFKTELQEHVQKKSGQTLEYRLAEERGPEHDKHFKVIVALNGTDIGEGEGRSKKEAEQNAAKAALEGYNCR